MKSVEVFCLRQFPATLLVLHHLFACATDTILQLSIMLRKTTQKTLTCFFFFHGHDDNSESVHSTSSEPVDNRPPAQEGKQTSQESASISKRLRSNQSSVKNVDCHTGSQA